MDHDMTPTTPRPVPNRPMNGIRRVSGGRVSDLALTEIQRYIEDNNLMPGHKLPPERTFIEQLGVSRSSVREALRVLATMGRIEIRHGDGMYITQPPDGWDDTETRLFDATEEHALRNLVETRLGIELAAATAAAMRASDDDLDALEALLDAQDEALRDDPDFAWEPLTFELALIEITGNTWLHEVELQLRDAWRSLSGGLRASVGRYQEWSSEHRAILASLRSRNVAQVQRMVIAHLSLERFEDDLQGRRQSRAVPTKGTTS
ncbi:MAG: FadR/GntR family transcriptional regulator [Acidimicrobiia bacterium]